MNDVAFSRREITASADDIALLRKFYRDIYIYEFPDPNERESLENMERYLRLKEEGWYEANNYHILLFLSDDTPVAGSIIDYLADPNTGVIEFLVVQKDLRKAGVGAQLLAWTENVLAQDATRAGYAAWDYIIAEMNDPFKSADLHDSMDTWERAMVWHRWGYRKMRFPYVQPSLSPDKEPVHNLLLMCKPGTGVNPDSIPPDTLITAVYDYARWAMRIDNPAANQECRDMAAYVRSQTTVPLVPLADYIGDPAGCRLRYSDLYAGDVTDMDLRELDITLDVYAQSFSGGPTSVSVDAFRTSIINRRHAGKPYAYHLLSIKTRSSDQPRGMASFFTFPGVGFGGYLVLDKSIRGKGHLTEIIRVAERTMLADKKGVSGWLGECDPEDDSLPAFLKRGFYEMDVAYRQPPLHDQPPYSFSDAPILHLIYKEFGDTFTAPRLTTKEFLAMISWVYRIIYRIEHPESCDYFQDIKKQLGLLPHCPWKSKID
ncbi:MAG: GNAT family N-acetyltransferase [candidate division Zixibacteria bacterium]|nr:GNAT family N-acetyltransferase [candidate division Zixibacteria bacterium]